MAGIAGLLVRYLHVAAMALAVGGALLIAAAIRLLPGGANRRTAAAFARAYEWLFWGALGVLVLTGVGNLGQFGAAVPGPETRWGSVLLAKLVAVLVLLGASLVRTLAVREWTADASLDGSTGALTVAYGATGAYLLGLLVLAEVLAHG